MLDVKLLHPDATPPTVAHKGEDLGYDLYALEDVELSRLGPTKVRTGIAVELYGVRLMPSALDPRMMAPVRTPLGGLILDRSSMASKGIFVTAGVLDAGYRGELIVLLNAQEACKFDDRQIKKGQKIAQLVPQQVMTGNVKVVENLTEMQRGDNGFGSSGN